MEKPALEHERRKVRQHIARLTWFGKSPRTDVDPPLYDHDEPMKTVVLNFTMGIDFERGARSLADLNDSAKYAVSTILNGLSWLDGKKHRASDADICVQRDVTITLELIPSQPGRSGVDDQAPPLQEIVGMRLWIDLVKSARTPYCLTSEQSQWLNPDADAPALTAVGARKRDEFLRKRGAQNRWLLSTALTASLQETHRLTGAVKALRKAHNMHDTREPHSLLQYKWARFENYSTLYFEGFYRYVTARDNQVRPRDRVGEVFLNPPDNINFADLHGLPTAYRPDVFFTKERAMYYKTVQGDAHWSYEHCNLGSYYHEIDANQFFYGDSDGDDRFPARPPLSALYAGETGDLRPLVPELLQRNYPRPDLVYVLPPNYLYAEVMLQFMALPFAMGARVPAPPPDERPQIEPFDVVPGLEAIKKLDEIEKSSARNNSHTAVLNAVTARPPPPAVATEAAPATPRRSLGDVLVQQSIARTPQHPSSSSSLSASRANPPPTPSRALSATVQFHRTASQQHERLTRELSGILETQTHNVRVFFSRAITAAARMAYAEFGPDDTRVVQSTTETVTPSEVVDRDGGLSEGDDIMSLALEINRMFEPNMLEDAGASQVIDTVLQKVDFIPAELRRRNVFNETRAKNQVNRALLASRQNAERIAGGGSKDDKLYPETPAGQALDVKHREERRQLCVKLMGDMLALVETTNNAPEAWIEARNYAKKNLENDAPSDQSDVIFDCIDGRPFLAVRQLFVDHYAAVALASQQNMSPLERCHMASFSAHRYDPNRSQPAPNYLMAGASGIGKSFVLKMTGLFAVPGLVQNTTATTTASYNVGKDFDHEIVIFEEMDSALLFSQRTANDTGATDKINFAKARLTSFVTSTQYFHRNEETNERESRRVLSSCHIVHLAGTNQYLAGMDEAMRRRIIVDYVMTVKAQTDGGKSTDTQMLSSFGQGASQKTVQHMQHQIHWAYMLVETAIRAAVIEDFPMDGAQIQLDAILGEAQRSCRMNDPSPTKRHWVLEIARTMAIIQACYMALYSPEMRYEYKYHSDTFPDEPLKTRLARWSPRMFTDIIFMMAVPTKDHVMTALEMFDFLFASRDEQQIIATLGEKLCHFSQQSKWSHRLLPNLSGGGGGSNDASAASARRLDEDPNYLVVSGTTTMRIFERIIQEHKLIAEPRAEDIAAIFRPFEKTMIKTRGLEFHRGVNGDRGVRHRLEGPLEQRPAIISEVDPRSHQKSTRTYQLCVSIEFLEELFNVNFEQNTPKEMEDALGGGPRITEAQYFDTTRDGGSGNPLLDTGFFEARRRAVATNARAPLIDPIRRALSHPVLEKSPYEHPKWLPLPGQVFHYITAYMPDDVHVDCGEGVGVVRVPMHGICLTLQLTRNPTASALRYSNYAKPLPTALRSVPEIAREPSRLMRGIVADTYDIDFYTAVQHMDTYGFAGLPGLTRAFLKACRAEAAAADRPWPAVLEAVPALRELEKTPVGGRAPLPFMFPPIMYRIKRYLYTHVYKKELDADFVARNIMTRVQDSVARNVRCSSNGGSSSSKVYMSYDTVVGLGNRYKRGHEVAFALDDDDAGINSILREMGPSKKRPRVAQHEQEQEQDAMDV